MLRRLAPLMLCACLLSPSTVHAERWQHDAFSLHLTEGWTTIDNPAAALPGHAQRDDLMLALQRFEGTTRHAVLVVFLVAPDLSPLRGHHHDAIQRYINRSATALQAQPGVRVIEQRVVTREGAPSLGLLRLHRDDDALRRELQLHDTSHQPVTDIEQLTLSLPSDRGLIQVFLYQPFPHDDDDTLATPLLASLKATPVTTASRPAQPLDRWLWILLAGVGFALILVRVIIALRQRQRRARLTTSPHTTAPPDLTRTTLDTPHAPWEQELTQPPPSDP